MRALEGFPAGDYMVLPTVQAVGRHEWRAGLSLSGGHQAGAPHLNQWNFERRFDSEEAARSFAVEQGELWASDPDTYLKPRLKG
jgi:hypothetical protein